VGVVLGARERTVKVVGPRKIKKKKKKKKLTASLTRIAAMLVRTFRLAARRRPSDLVHPTSAKEHEYEVRDIPRIH
jgi:hypothetical protein